MLSIVFFFFFLQNDAHKVRIYTVKHDCSMVPGTNDLNCMGSLKPKFFSLPYLYIR